MRNIFIGLLLLAFVSCNRGPVENENRSKDKNNKILYQPHDGTTIADIPLVTTIGPSTKSKNAISSMDKSKSVRSNLVSLGFSEINIARKDRIQSWQKSYALLEEKIQAGKIGNAEIEYEATVILRDLKLLSDASAKAKTSIKKLLDILLEIKSCNISLEYHSLVAIKNELDQNEVNTYAQRILEINSEDRSYKVASFLKNKIERDLADHPELYEKLGDDPGFIATLKYINACTSGPSYYKNQLLALH